MATYGELFVAAMEEQLKVVDAAKVEIENICEQILKMVDPLVQIYKTHANIGKDIANSMDTSSPNGYYRLHEVLTRNGWAVRAEGYDDHFTITVYVDTGDYTRTPGGVVFTDAPSFYVNSDYKREKYSVSFLHKKELEYRIVPQVVEAWKNSVGNEVTANFKNAYVKALSYDI